MRAALEKAGQNEKNRYYADIFGVEGIVTDFMDK
jgi:hypothetical protein